MPRSKRKSCRTKRGGGWQAGQVLSFGLVEPSAAGAFQRDESDFIFTLLAHHGRQSGLTLFKCVYQRRRRRWWCGEESRKKNSPEIDFSLSSGVVAFLNSLFFFSPWIYILSFSLCLPLFLKSRARSSSDSRIHRRPPDGCTRRRETRQIDFMLIRSLPCLFLSALQCDRDWRCNSQPVVNLLQQQRSVCSYLRPTRDITRHYPMNVFP